MCIQPIGYVANFDDCNHFATNITAIGQLCDDGNTRTSGEILNDDCIYAESIEIPTISQWGIIVLALNMLVPGILFVKQRKAIIANCFNKKN